MERLSRLLYDRCVLPVARCLVEYGSYWVYVPPVEPAHVRGLVPPDEELTGPAEGHPERLCPDVPLSAVERELARSLGVPG